MTLRRFSGRGGIILCSLLGVLAMLSVAPAMAESSLLNAAEKEIAGKKYKRATRTITKAMNSGNLSEADMAQALYRRGTAYNLLGRPASAIADFTGALSLGKLPGKKRSDAYRQRANAYKSVGLSSEARRDLSRAGSGAGAATKRASNRSRAQKNASALSGFNTVVKKAAVPTRRPSRSKPAKKAPIPSFRTSINPD